MKSTRELETKDKDFEEDVVKAPTVKIPEKYVITVDNLALRDAPKGRKIGIAPAGNTLVSEVKDGFGKLADGSGWVMMSYLRKVD